MSPDAINRLLGADTTPDKRWIDWIFFQAGGGQAGKDGAVTALRQIRARFIDERTHGWTHPDSGEYNQPVPMNVAEQRWANAEQKFRDVLAVGNQDVVRKLRIFGFFRDMPGENNRYQNVIEVMTKYLKLYSKLLQMNKEQAKEGQPPLPETPQEIPKWELMGEIATKVERYFASKKARTDIRVETVYDDDVITALIPLTYAAAVRFGYDAWPWASRTGFEQVLSGDRTDFRFRDVWKDKTSRGNVFVYLTFKVPVPAWITRREGTWEMKDLTDLALELDEHSAKGNPDSWTVYDQENRNVLTIAQVKQEIMAEPTREVTRNTLTANEPVNPVQAQQAAAAEADNPILRVMRGRNRYQTAEEAQRVVNSLNQAVTAVKRALANFEKTKVKPDVLTLD